MSTRNARIRLATTTRTHVAQVESSRTYLHNNIQYYFVHTRAHEPEYMVKRDGNYLSATEASVSLPKTCFDDDALAIRTTRVRTRA